ncbi:MAG: hypothetical protein Q8Q35_02815 [Nanoarchaeota archaeon]|nr:hypothetical protein [Nanoarchaeota archaeon]
MSERFNGCNVYAKLISYFFKSIDVIWDNNQSTHCTNLNYILRYLLIHSGKFTEKDIKRKYSLVLYILPHQFLKVNVGKKWIIADSWD